MQIIMPQLKKLENPAKQIFAQFADRGYKLQYEDEDNKLRTKLKAQSEVDALYTGTEMASD